MAGALIIAVIMPSANSVMPVVITRFYARLLEVTVVLHAAPAPEVVRLVEDRRVKSGAVSGPVGRRQVVVRYASRRRREINAASWKA